MKPIEVKTSLFDSIQDQLSIAYKYCADIIKVHQIAAPQFFAFAESEWLHR